MERRRMERTVPDAKLRHPGGPRQSPPPRPLQVYATAAPSAGTATRADLDEIDPRGTGGGVRAVRRQLMVTSS